MSSKKGRHAPHEEHVDESWLIPYADILTLLLALFIVLFATSSVDQEKYTAVMAAFRGEFNPGSTFEGGAEDGSGIMIPPELDQNQNGILDIYEKDPNETPEPPDDSGATDDPGAAIGGAVGNVYHSLTDYVSGNNLENTVKVDLIGEAVLVTLQNDIWFASGSADLTAEMREKGGVLAQILRDTQDTDDPFEIITVGYTDDRPIATAQFPSNLHLSSYRAAAFQLFLIDESGLDPEYFSCRGNGEKNPIADNSTAEGRARNRRVELLISQNKKQSGGTGVNAQSEQTGVIVG